MKYVPKDDLTKYEKTRIISARALQIAENAPIMIDKKNKTRSLDLAQEEFKEDKIPLHVKRKTMAEEQKEIEL